ncbi:MAG TPA: phospholipid carrier-dependent glycosyltransferase [Vicinamibacteria bacterium]
MSRARPEAVILAGLVASAAALRVWGIGSGLPHPVARPDEELLVGKALQISVGRLADPGDFNYSHLVYYLHALALFAYRTWGRLVGSYGSTEDFLVDVAVRHPGVQYLVCRSLVACLGTATVLATHAAAFHAYRRRGVAFLASALVAANYLHARDSHFGTVDVPMTLFVTLALAFALRATGTQARRDVLPSGLFAGLATSAKYNAGVVILCVFVALSPRLFQAREPRQRLNAVATLILACATAALAFAVTSPFCVLRFGDVLRGLVVQEKALFRGPGTPAWSVYLGTTLPGAFGGLGYLAAAAGLARALWKRRPSDRVLLVLVAATFASMAGMTWVVPRYPLPMVPALAVLAAEASLALVPSGRAALATALGVLLAASPLARTLAYDRLASRADTRLLAAEWVAAHLPPRSAILVCRGYGAPAINDDHRRPPAFKPRLVPCRVGAIEEGEARYVVTHDHPVVDFFRLPDDTKAWLEARARRLATFDPFRAGARVSPYFYPQDAFYLPWSGFAALERGGPIVTIWELPSERRPAP